MYATSTRAQPIRIRVGRGGQQRADQECLRQVEQPRVEGDEADKRKTEHQPAGEREEKRHPQMKLEILNPAPAAGPGESHHQGGPRDGPAAKSSEERCSQLHDPSKSGAEGGRRVSFRPASDCAHSARFVPRSCLPAESRLRAPSRPSGAPWNEAPSRHPTSRGPIRSRRGCEPRRRAPGPRGQSSAFHERPGASGFGRPGCLSTQKRSASLGIARLPPCSSDQQRWDRCAARDLNEAQYRSGCCRQYVSTNRR